MNNDRKKKYVEYQYLRIIVEVSVFNNASRRGKSSPTPLAHGPSRAAATTPRHTTLSIKLWLGHTSGCHGTAPDCLLRPSPWSLRGSSQDATGLRARQRRLCYYYGTRHLFPNLDLFPSPQRCPILTPTATPLPSTNIY